MTATYILVDGVWTIKERQMVICICSKCYSHPGQPFWLIKEKELFFNVSLIEIIKTTFFGTRGAIGHKFKSYYKSSHLTHLELEMPASLVALMATGVGISHLLTMWF